MARRLAELDRLDALRLPYPPRKPRRLGTISSLILLAGAVGAVVWWTGAGRHTHTATTESPPITITPLTQSPAKPHIVRRAPRVLTGRDVSSPEPGLEEHSSRLLPAVSAPGVGDYKFLAMNGTKPVSYDACRPIHYVIRDLTTPVGGDDAVRVAIADLSRATGLKFVFDGMTRETPSSNRSTYQPYRYGDRFALVLIAWTNATEVPGLAGHIFGLGGSGSFTRSASVPPTYVSGFVYLDAPDIVAAQVSSGYAISVMSVVEHELGHLVGLNHVTDPAQLMYPESHGQSGYQAGDLRGLAIEGSGSCRPEL